MFFYILPPLKRFYKRRDRLFSEFLPICEKKSDTFLSKKGKGAADKSRGAALLFFVVNIDGIFAVVRDVAALEAAFPDITVRVGAMVVTGDPEQGFQVWARTYFNGTNLGYSRYGAPTGRKLEGDSCMTLSMLKLERIGGRWKIVQEATMFSDATLRRTMGG